MNAGGFGWCERLLSATANGVYQGILVTVLAGLALRWFTRTNAATRHAVWFGTLLFVAALIPAHFLLSFRARPEVPAVATEAAPSMTSVTAVTAECPAANADFLDPQPRSSDNASSARTPYLPGTGPQDGLAGEKDVYNDTPESAATERRWPSLTPAIFNLFDRNVETAVSLPHPICLCLVLAWFLLTSVRCSVIAGRIGKIRRIKKTSGAPSQGLQTLFDSLRDSLATRRNVRLRISNAHRTAVVLGFVHPVILLPAEMDYSASDSEVEQVLRHELAHVNRRDDWGNLVQQLIQAALFFHPAVWWISAKLSLEREIACDDHVLEANGRPRVYALTLANLAGRMNHCRHLLAPGVSNNHSQLQQRITMILNTQRDHSPRLAGSRLGLFTTATAVLAALAISAGPRLVLARQPVIEPTTSAPEQPAPLAEPEPVAAAATLATPAEAPVAVAAVTPAPAPPDWSGPDSAPRAKPTASEDDSEPGTPPTPAVAPVPMVSVTPPAAPRPMRRHMSVEERLDRIERMLEELQARGGSKGDARGYGRSFGGGGGGGGTGFFSTFPPGANQFGQAAGSVAEFAAKRATADTQMVADQVRRAVEAGQRAADQAMRDLAKLKTTDFARLQEDLRAADTENSLKTLQALREAREALQAQMKSLEHEIQRFEQSQKRLQKADRSDDSDDDPKAEQPTQRK
jgi:beta-lactamase regulating signal transducer with metallopeptidase domain